MRDASSATGIDDSHADRTRPADTVAYISVRAMLASMGERRELIVHGTPVSVNSKGTRYNRWRQQVNEQAYRSIDEEQKLDSLQFPKVSVMIAYFHQPESQLDLDNIAEGILDGICGPVLSDDSQVTELVLRRVALRGFVAKDPAPEILAALSTAASENSEFILVRAEPDAWNGVL